MKLGSKLFLAWTVLRLLLSLVSFLLKCLEPLLFLLVKGYDKYVYNPLQTWLSPLVQRVPREIKVGEVRVTVFTANIVSWARTVLVIPIAICLKYHLNWGGCLLVLLHDFLDHLDGIVAKVQRRIYGKVDDPLLGGFMDAFCDKIVNVLALWSVLMVTDFSTMTWLHLLLYLTPIVLVIGFEFTLGVVRVQDYFYSYYIRELKKSDDMGYTGQATASVMEGKLKEKLESMGIACLCVAQAAPVLMDSVSGIMGVVCLFLSIRLAHSSLSRKLATRKERKPLRDPPRGPTVGSCLHRLMTRRSAGVQVDLPSSPTYNSDFKFDCQESSDMGEKAPTPHRRTWEDQQSHFTRSLFVSGMMEERVEKVYTVGCFDLFHDGHIRLLQRMRSLGREVIVGVHDSRSIYLLKKRVPVDSTEKRMLNVKQYADMVFCIAGTDPTNFLSFMFPMKVAAGGNSRRQKDSTSLYVRGDDMPNFPARELCERLMPIIFLPYTKGVSSTKLRKDIYNSSQSDPRLDLDANFFY